MFQENIWAACFPTPAIVGLWIFRRKMKWSYHFFFGGGVVAWPNSFLRTKGTDGCIEGNERCLICSQRTTCQSKAYCKCNSEMDKCRCHDRFPLPCFWPKGDSNICWFYPVSHCPGHLPTVVAKLGFKKTQGIILCQLPFGSHKPHPISREKSWEKID